MNQGAKGHVYFRRKNIHIVLVTYPWSRGLTGDSIHHRIHEENGQMTLGVLGRGQKWGNQLRFQTDEFLDFRSFPTPLRSSLLDVDHCRQDAHPMLRNWPLGCNGIPCGV